MAGLIELVAVSKTYGAGPGAVTALDRIDIELAKGSFTAMMGPSGSGKSTFPHCAASLDRPSEGAVLLGETDPSVLKEDEPTGALDTRTGRQVLELLRHIVDRTGQTVLMVTHDPVAASFADRVAFLADGRLAGFLDHPTQDAIAARMTHLGESCGS